MRRPGADGEVLGDSQPQAREKRVHVRRPRCRQDRSELVAADPTGDVRLPQRARESGCEGAQDAIAFLVPLAVVPLLEVVEVEEEERDTSPVAPRPRRLQRELRVQGAVVEKAR